MPVMRDVELARFIDRWTMEHVRIYPHPVERVWRALTESEHIAKWFGEADIELRIGGRARFGPEDEPWFTTVITALEPGRMIEFGAALPRDLPGFIRYELSDVEGGCRMVFTQHFEPGDRFEPGEDGDPGGDLPAGPGTPWMPGFVGGWHEFFDLLGDSLEGLPAGLSRDRWLELNEIYREYIPDAIPPA
jgi:uncharacterized protein YndB with AHSA1/START domain